jgi:hypothetical protein
MLFWTLGLFFFFNLKNVLREEELGSLNLTTVVSWVPFWFQIYLWVSGSSLVCNTLNLTLNPKPNGWLSTFRHWCMMLLSWTLSWMFWYTVDMVIYVMLCHDLPFVLWIRSHKIGCHHTFFFETKLLVFCCFIVLHEQRREVRDQLSWSCKFEESMKENERRNDKGGWKLWNIVVTLKMLNFRNPRASCFMPNPTLQSRYLIVDNISLSYISIEFLHKMNIFHPVGFNNVVSSIVNPREDCH